MKDLTTLAESSVLHTDAMAAQNLGPVMTRLLMDSVAKERRDTAFFRDLNRLAVALMENAPRLERLGIDRWVRPLVFALADGLAEEDVECMATALESLTVLCQTGNRKAVQSLKRKTTLWSLLQRLGQRQENEIKIRVARLLRALSNVGLKPEDDRTVWEQLLLNWISEGRPSLSQATSAALTDFVAEDDAVPVAKRWLSRILVEASQSPALRPPPANSLEQTEPWVVPSYMRYVADEIAGHVPPMDPPDYPDLHHHALLEPLMLDWEEDAAGETAVSRGLSILCDFAAESRDLCDWLLAVGVLPACSLWKRQRSLTAKEELQITRLLALLAQEHFDGGSFVDWLPWLELKARQPELGLASHAVRALMHFRNGQTEGDQKGVAVPDGLHFFDPERERSGAIDGTAADVVFVHGIRGGPFVTWRREGTSRVDHSKDSCWPSGWLAGDVPEARLLSVQFPAPVSSWEGGSSPLRQTAQKLLENLLRAGIGERPLIFVAHSMGGLVVKELLCQSLDDPSASHLADNTKGLVFVSTPHHGVWLAKLAWGLRHVGACPAPTLHTMRPGLYLEALNDRMQAWVEGEEVPVLSFAETLATDVTSMLPRLQVVAQASAFPGFGELVTLEGLDHVNSCKPKTRSDAFYRHLLAFVDEVINNLREKDEEVLHQRRRDIEVERGLERQARREAQSEAQLRRKLWEEERLARQDETGHCLAERRAQLSRKLREEEAAQFAEIRGTEETAEERRERRATEARRLEEARTAERARLREALMERRFRENCDPLRQKLSAKALQKTVEERKRQVELRRRVLERQKREAYDRMNQEQKAIKEQRHSADLQAMEAKRAAFVEGLAEQMKRREEEAAVLRAARREEQEALQIQWNAQAAQDEAAQAAVPAETSSGKKPPLTWTSRPDRRRPLDGPETPLPRRIPPLRLRPSPTRRPPARRRCSRAAARRRLLRRDGRRPNGGGASFAPVTSMQQTRFAPRLRPLQWRPPPRLPLRAPLSFPTERRPIGTPKTVVCTGGEGGSMAKRSPDRGRPVETWQSAVLVGVAISWISFIVLLPFFNVFVQAFADGVGPFFQNVADPDFLHAVQMTLTLAAICVPINTVFGIACALELARNEFPGKQFLLSLLDLPFSISPVVVGLMLILLYGRDGLLAPLLRHYGFNVVFAFPGMVLATMFVTMPFVARELIPILEEQDMSEEEAARKLGASDWEVFWNVTLPNIRWGLLYGVILPNARAMGEFGAVAVISGNIIGQTQTLTLFVESAYKKYNTSAAF